MTAIGRPCISGKALHFDDLGVVAKADIDLKLNSAELILTTTSHNVDRQGSRRRKPGRRSVCVPHSARRRNFSRRQFVGTEDCRTCALLMVQLYELRSCRQASVGRNGRAGHAGLLSWTSVGRSVGRRNVYSYPRGNTAVRQDAALTFPRVTIR